MRLLPAETWTNVEWREGSNETLSSRFAELRVWLSARDHTLTEPHPVEWLVIEWPEGEAEPTTYWLFRSTDDYEADVGGGTPACRG